MVCLFMFRAGVRVLSVLVIDVRCYIIYYILYYYILYIYIYIYYYYILLSYTILFLFFFSSFPSLPFYSYSNPLIHSIRVGTYIYLFIFHKNLTPHVLSEWMVEVCRFY